MRDRKDETLDEFVRWFWTDGVELNKKINPHMNEMCDPNAGNIASAKDMKCYVERWIETVDMYNCVIGHYPMRDLLRRLFREKEQIEYLRLILSK